MKTGSEGERKQRILNLLKKASDQKLLTGGTREAMQKLKKARNLARCNPPLEDPWKAVIAYRMAHLILRDPGSSDKLKEADKLLAKASSAKFLGPLPFVYRIAVLHRLKNEMESDYYRRRLDQAVKQAASNCASPPERFEDESDPLALEANIQDCSFNMLELAVYFTGASYDPLEGLGVSPQLRFETTGWLLLGHDPSLSRVQCPREMVLEELRNREAKASSPVLAFYLEDGTKGWLRRAEGSSRQSRQQVCYLAHILYRQARDQSDLLRYFFESESEADMANLRQIKNRLARTIEALTGVPSGQVYAEDPESPLPRLAPCVPVLGAVEVSALRPKWWS